MRSTRHHRRLDERCLRQRVVMTPELRAARKPRERDEPQQTSDIDRPACTATSVRVEAALLVYERVGEERKRSDNDCADRETEDDVVLHERSMDSGASLARVFRYAPRASRLRATAFSYSA